MEWRKKEENISISYAFTVLEYLLVQMENNYMVEHCQIVFFKNYIMLQQKGWTVLNVMFAAQKKKSF